MKKKNKIVLSIVSMFCIIALSLHIFSYHDKNESSMIVKVSYSNYLGEIIDKQYTSRNDIERLTKKLERINFYPISDYILQESPTGIIRIEYEDGSEKEFRIAGIFVLISTTKEKSDDKTVQSYIVNPIALKNIFS